MFQRPPRHELECKMTIVVRADQKSGITGAGTSAKLVSIAVMRAYEACKIKDPISLAQWESMAWTKIALKVNSETQLNAVATKAEQVGLNYYVLKHPVKSYRKVVNHIKHESQKIEEKQA